MSIFKRAILYISRNKTRTILLVIILAFLMLISLNGIAIKSSVDRESEKVRSEYGSSFIIESNYDDFDADEEVIELEDGTTVRIYTGPKIVDEAIEEICSVSILATLNFFPDCLAICTKRILLMIGMMLLKSIGMIIFGVVQPLVTVTEIPNMTLFLKTGHLNWIAAA